ncbi:hypothetical protein [Thermococcus waiotapuensis]|uniref:Uncharacterized protein n=1 Tax=Thermococcus waiotapuensis TaxID=90909 RepID=A0AAE4T225_9EURY|nr:hypothetical protein [Thermococcus waiotapuensis]MDV3103687.1 hypothetical protein [Thermococcus waiotapuensis]
MDAKKGASLFILFLLALAVGYIAFNVIKPEPDHQVSQSPPDFYQSPSPSKYAELFGDIIRNYSTYYLMESALYGEYLWDGLNQETYNCTLTKNATLLKEKVNNLVSMYKNLSKREVSERSVVGVLLLGDLGFGISSLSSEGEEQLRRDLGEICILEGRLTNFDSFKKRAVEVYGEPSFSYEKLSNLSSHLEREVSRTYGIPFSGEWPVETRFALQHFVYILSQNSTLLDSFLNGYDPEKSYNLLKTLLGELDENPYAKALFRPSIVYLSELWREEYVLSQNKAAVDDHYLRVFWAWYQLVKPEQFIG